MVAAFVFLVVEAGEASREVRTQVDGTGMPGAGGGKDEAVGRRGRGGRGACDRVLERDDDVTRLTRAATSLPGRTGLPQTEVLVDGVETDTSSDTVERTVKDMVQAPRKTLEGAMTEHQRQVPRKTGMQQPTDPRHSKLTIVEPAKRTKQQVHDGGRERERERESERERGGRDGRVTEGEIDHIGSGRVPYLWLEFPFACSHLVKVTCRWPGVCLFGFESRSRCN